MAEWAGVWNSLISKILPIILFRYTSGFSFKKNQLFFKIFTALIFFLYPYIIKLWQSDNAFVCGGESRRR